MIPRVRTVWISDVHLGFRGCSADRLLDFLRSVESDFLYLVGDIIDVLEMRRRLFWPRSHNQVVRTILGQAKRGTNVIYVPGNHDELFRDYCGTVFGTSGSPGKRSTSKPTANASSSSTATNSTASCVARRPWNSWE